MIRKIAIFIFSVMVFPIILSAQVPAKEMVSPPASSDQKIQGDKLYLDFKDTPLINVLGVLSQLSGINFIAGKEISDRKVNLILDGVTLQDALETLALGTNVSYEFIPERNVYVFRGSSSNPDEPPLLTRVYKLYYLRVSSIREIQGGGSSGGSGGGDLSEDKAGAGDKNSSIIKIIENVLSARGKVSTDDRSNSLVVTDSADRLRIIDKVIAELDRSVDQVLIQLILIETYEQMGDKLGITWTTEASGGTFGTIIGGKRTNSRFPFNVSIKRFFFHSLPL